MATRFDPFREMERAFNTAYRSTSGTPSLPLDLFRDGDVFTAYIDMPGVDGDNIDIDVEDRTLTIRAKREQPSGDKLEWLAHERPSGTYARQLTIGYGVAADKIEADYTDGVLKLTIPVAEEAKPRKINVTHSGGKKTIDAE